MVPSRAAQLRTRVVVHEPTFGGFENLVRPKRMRAAECGVRWFGSHGSIATILDRHAGYPPHQKHAQPAPSATPQRSIVPPQSEPQRSVELVLLEPSG